MLQVDIIQRTPLPATIGEQQLVDWARLAYPEESEQPVEVSVAVVDENEIRSLNLAYRKQDKATNVLAFPAGESPSAQTQHLGDIVMCVEVIGREAQAQGKTVEAHWAHLVVHGMLHLQGYDHALQDDALLMENTEIDLLAKIGITNPYTPINTH